jgi:hypothetical protein
LPDAAEVAGPGGLVAAVWAQQPHAQRGDLGFDLAPGQVLVGQDRTAGGERRAERAEANAADAVDFASYAVDEAGAAALEAADARKIADALNPSEPSSTGEE